MQNNRFGGCIFTVKKIWDKVTVILIIMTMLLALMLLGGRLFGMENFIVLSGSMEPAYHTGSLVYVKSVGAEELAVGDPITFQLTEDTVATHRIIEVIESGGACQYRTKGDANDTADGSLVSESDIVGKVVFAVPYLGYFTAFIQTGAGRAAAIAYGAFLLLMLILPELFFGDENNEEEHEIKE